jgi:hypothetical protein
LFTMANCFVYGTLLFPEVLQALLNRQPKAAAAVLRGFRRQSIRDQVFPGVIAATADSQVGAATLAPTARPPPPPPPPPPLFSLISFHCLQVQGLILHDLSSEEMEIFDEFEGDEYTKTEVRPELISGAAGSGGDAVVPCSVYVWRHDLEPLLYGDWDPQGFREKHLDSYVQMCARFAADLREQRQPGSRPLGFQ